MKRIAAILFLLACMQAALADTRLITVNGYCYLEGQSEHSETKVKFIKVSPSAITDSTYTDSSGYFFITDLYEGIYDIEYTHAGFDTIRVEDQLLVSGTTLPPVTLNWPFSDVDGYCYLEGQSEHSETKVKFINVSPSAITDSTYTDSSGYFMLTGLHEGTYDEEYTHEGFDSVTIEDQTFVSSTTLPPVILLRPPCPPCEVSGHLEGILGPDTCHVVGTIYVDSGDSLTLLPRTVFIFDGPYSFVIYGTLLAEGTESDSIVFTTEQSGSNRRKGLRFSLGSSGSRLAYCLIERGNAIGYGGGGVYCCYSSPSFTNCTIRDNSTYYSGGGVDCESSSPIFTQCTISGNSAGGHGGGVFCGGGSPTFTNCTIGGNSTTSYGGGVFCFQSSPIFMNCTLSGNSAGEHGGGVYCQSSSPSFTNCTIGGNSATSYGGGVDCYYSSATFTNCTISTNSASYGGGGVYCQSSSPSFTSCMIAGNYSDYGGGVYCGTSAIFTNCTLSGNSAGEHGGGVYCEYSSPIINSTIIVFSTGVGIYFCGSAGSQISYCDLFGNSGGNLGNPSEGPPMIGVPLVMNANADSADIYMNIFVDPMFADTAAGDFHLTDFSHCIGAGDPADTVSTDFEGDPRPSPSGSYSDIGMDENPHGAAIPGLVISVDNGNAVLKWLPFGVSGTVYNIYGSTQPFAAGVLLHSTTNTNWTDEETSTRPSLFFYYVTAQ